MGAKDTVMNNEEIGRRWNIHQPTLVHGGLVTPLLEAQAKITWPVAFTAGQDQEKKGIVEWIIDECDEIRDPATNELNYYGIKPEDLKSLKGNK